MPHQEGAKENVESLTKYTHMHRRLGLTQFDQPHTTHAHTFDTLTHIIIDIHTHVECIDLCYVHNAKEYEESKLKEKTIRAVVEPIIQSVNQT